MTSWSLNNAQCSVEVVGLGVAWRVTATSVSPKVRPPPGLNSTNSASTPTLARPRAKPAVAKVQRVAWE